MVENVVHQHPFLPSVVTESHDLLRMVNHNAETSLKCMKPV